MPHSLLILGRQPALGLAELESLYGPDTLQPVGNVAVLCDKPPNEIDFKRLGGSIKLCEVLSHVSTWQWNSLQKTLLDTALSEAGKIQDGKIQLGLSAYDLKLSPRQLTAAGLEIKKALRSRSRSVRLMQNQELTLNSAQVLHNHLTGERGIELVLIKDGPGVIIARTVAEQDIASYTERDRGRPKRDARVGMLPPKLAQIIINLSGAEPWGNVWDPFCGTGVLLQEAQLMEIDAYGSDIEPRMIEYTKANLSWLNEQFGFNSSRGLDIAHFVAVGDATTIQLAEHFPAPVGHVACETYLGRPFTSPPSPDVLAKTISDVNLILKKFLQNISQQIVSGTRLCLAIPAWQVKPGQFKHLPLVDQLGDLGYNRISFEHVRDEELLYYREDQIVARQLLVITRK